MPICDSALRYDLAPDGKWIAGVCSAAPAPFVRVLSLDQVFDWKIPYDITRNNPDGYLFPFHWSTDGKYLYLTPFPQVDGFVYFNDGDALLRLNLETGRISEIVTGDGSGRSFYAFSFSPGDRRLAYIYSDDLPLTLNILDTQLGERVAIPLDKTFVSAGSILWSHKAERIIYAAATDWDTTSFVLVSLNLANAVQTIIPTPGGLLLDPIEWQDENTIIVSNRASDRQLWRLNLETGEFVSQ